MEWIAHRGASHDAPENTLAAVRLAWEQRADAVEVDVRLSSDGVVIVFHDEDASRICGVDRKVAHLSFGELRKLDAGASKGKAWKGERIPSLEQVLEIVPRGKRLFVEIKAGPEIVAPIGSVLDRQPEVARKVALIGFDEQVMRAAKEQHPTVTTLWVRNMEHDETRDQWSPEPGDLLEKVTQWGLDGVDVKACEAVDPGFVRTFANAGKQVYVWTVDEPEEARRLRRAGVTGITTNRPAWLRTQCEAT